MLSYTIRKNTPEIKEKLNSLGFYVCPCTEMKSNEEWLFIISHSVHVIVKEDQCTASLDFNDTNDIDCGLDEEKFFEGALKIKSLWK